jgi:hypothetical protein
MSQEYTPLQDNQEIWDGALAALREERTTYMGYDLKTVPPESTEPEEIHLIEDVDSRYKAGSRTLMIGENGPVGYKYDILSLADTEPEEIVQDFAADDTQTLQKLGQLARRIRDRKA